MRMVVALVVGALLGGAPVPASAESETVTFGFAERTICVIARADAEGWRVDAAVRAWNSAQDVVQLSSTLVPGCGVIEIRTFSDVASDHNGRTDWPRWSEGSMVDGQWRYHHAEVWLNEGLMRPLLRGPLKETRDTRCRLKSVVVHEIGHALGLPHTTGGSSVMSAKRNIKRYCGKPSEGDAFILEVLN